MVSLEFVCNLAREAGEIAKAALDKEKLVSEKLNASDLLTQTDVEVENFIKAKIKGAFPDHRFICEESEHDERLGNDPTWIIDPIDGTMNFVYGMPTFCISVAFADAGRVQLGAVYNPLADELFVRIQATSDIGCRERQGLHAEWRTHHRIEEHSTKSRLRRDRLLCESNSVESLRRRCSLQGRSPRRRQAQHSGRDRQCELKVAHVSCAAT